MPTNATLRSIPGTFIMHHAASNFTPPTINPTLQLTRPPPLRPPPGLSDPGRPFGGLGGASRGSGEPGGAHAGFLPGDPGLGIHGRSRRRGGGIGGGWEGEGVGEARRMARRICVRQEIDLTAGNRGR